MSCSSVRSASIISTESKHLRTLTNCSMGAAAGGTIDIVVHLIIYRDTIDIVAHPNYISYGTAAWGLTAIPRAGAEYMRQGQGHPAVSGGWHG